MLNIKNNQREFASVKPDKRIVQVERGEVFYRDDLKTSFAYALVATTAITVAIGITLGVAGMGYSFVKQLRKE
jgi:hypothetical protein